MVLEDQHKSQVTAQQKKFLVHMLDGGDTKHAAKTANISMPTAYRWLRNPVVHWKYRELRPALMEQVITELQRVATGAVRTLVEISDDQQAPPSSRVSAARAILEFSLRAQELVTIDERLAQIEARVEGIDSADSVRNAA